MLIFEQIRNGECLSYIIGCTRIREAIVVDPSGDINKFIKFLEHNRLSPSFIVETHTHSDHVSIAPELSRITGARIAMSDQIKRQREVTKVPTQTIEKNLNNDIKRPIKDQEKIALGEISVYFFHTPGHTKDSMCLYVENRILTGDTLHIGTIADERMEGFDAEELFDSISQRIMSLGPDAIIYPSHDHTGAYNSSLGYEITHNPYLKAKGKEEFLRMVKDGVPQSRPAQSGMSAQEIFVATIAQDILAKNPDTKINAESLLSGIVDNKFSLIDVRRPDEFSKGHIATATNIPLPELPLRDQDIPKDVPVIIISNNQNRSAIAALYLKEIAGLQGIKILENGIASWVTASYPLE